MVSQSLGVREGSGASDVGADSDHNLDQLFEMVIGIDRRLSNLTDLLAELREVIGVRQPQKEWYSTAELAALLKKSDFTVREKWCNQGRIECEKDPGTGKWRIPAQEAQRLHNGGGLKPPRPRDVTTAAEGAA